MKKMDSFFKKIFVIALLFSFAATVLVSKQIIAQESKPKLVPITLNEQTNDPQAIEIAKKLDPTYFNLIVPETSTNKFDYYAKFINYNGRKLLIFQPTDLYFICNARGCPILVYQNLGQNEWRLVAELHGHTLFYDQNSSNKKMPNIILRTLRTKTTNGVSVFIWNGYLYQRVNK